MESTDLLGPDAGAAPATPWPIFTAWYTTAEAAQPIEPSAMTLATVAPDGSPSARIVLMRGFDERGIVFYTNYQSRKAEELAANAARHGGASAVNVELSALDEGVSLRFEDDGAPFDPTARSGFVGPDPQTGGGVGLELVLRWCEALAYAREGATNRLDLRLRRTPDPEAAPGRS